MSLTEEIQRAQEWYESLSAVDKALHDEQQKRSWVKGETGRDPGFSVLACEVLRLRGELREHRESKLNSEARSKLQVLKKRAYHLANRIERSPRYELTYDKSELSAIRWAIQKISGEVVTGIDEPIPLPQESSGK